MSDDTTTKPGSEPLHNERHELFAQEVATGRAKTESFLVAYPHAAAWKPQSAQVKASMMAARPDVRARIAFIQSKAADAAVFTLSMHLSRLDHLSQAAERAGEFTSAVKAEENRGKAAGFYVERIEAAGPGGQPLMPSVIQLVGPDGTGAT